MGLYHEQIEFVSIEVVVLGITDLIFGEEFRVIIKWSEVEKLDEIMYQAPLSGYRPFSIEEYVTEMLENSFLFKNCSAYFLWAAGVMKI